MSNAIISMAGLTLVAERFASYLHEARGLLPAAIESEPCQDLEQRQGP